MDNLKVTTAELRCRVNIYEKVLTPDGMGGNAITYSLRNSAWAKITDWRGYLRYVAERVNAQISQIVVVRAGVTVGIDDVIVYNGRPMPVQYMTNQVDGKVHWQVLYCMEGAPTGWDGSLS